MFTSCNTYKHSYRLSNVPNNSLAVTPLVVDVATDFETKITASSDKKTVSVQDAKANAYFNAIQNNNIDVLVDPIYSVRIQRRLFKSTASATVSGFAGNYVNTRALSALHQEAFDAKLSSLEEFLKLDAIVNEEMPTTIINNCCGGCESGGTSRQTFDGAPALIDQFNALYGASESGGSSVAVSDNEEPIIGSPAQKSGILSKIRAIPGRIIGIFGFGR